LNLARAAAVAKRCFLFEQFVEDLLNREPDALPFKTQPGFVAIHSSAQVGRSFNIGQISGSESTTRVDQDIIPTVFRPDFTTER
jgi:hypothetical protein